MEEIYRNLSSPKSKEFEKLLNTEFSKSQISEGKIVDGTITKITNKHMIHLLLFSTICIMSSFTYGIYSIAI